MCSPNKPLNQPHLSLNIVEISLVSKPGSPGGNMKILLTITCMNFLGKENVGG